MYIDFNCPNCKKSIEIYVYQWNSKTICPKCKSKLLVEYDFYYGDNHEEHPVYELSILSSEMEKSVFLDESKNK